MKSSLFLVASGALLAMASPINKRAMETVWEQVVVTTTVTYGSEPTGAVFVQQEEAAPTVPAAQPTTAAPAAPVVSKSKTKKVQKAVTKTIIASEAEYAAPVAQPTQAAPKVEKAKTSTKVEEVKTSTIAAAAPIQTADVSGDYKATVLKQHNVHRMNHSAPALQWSDELASTAANLAKSCVFEHDRAGQNLASWGASGDIDDKEIWSAAGGITNQWYNDEMNNWGSYGESDPPSNQALDAFGHFTQVVWKNTQQVGCATIKCPSGSVLGMPSWYTVCNYEPAGNYAGEYGNNVLKPLGQATVRI